MTDSLDRLATPKRASDWLSLVARTDGPTDSRSGYSTSDESSPNATHAGGQDDFSGGVEQGCAHTPHMYVVYWPSDGILKVGVSEKARWEWWTRLGAVPIATLDVCCMDFARKLEASALKVVRRYGARAFDSPDQAKNYLGQRKGGYTECVRMVQSPRYGQPADSDYDYERAYGLILPSEFVDFLVRYEAAFRPVQQIVAAS